MVKDAEAAFATAPEDRAPYELFAAVKKACQAFVGTTYLTMSHDEAWHFSRMGRLVERAEKTSRILDVKSYLLDVPGSRCGSDEIEWAAAPEVGERVRDVPAAARRARPPEGARLPRPRPEVPALDFYLRPQGRALAPRDHRDAARRACVAGGARDRPPPRGARVRRGRRDLRQGLNAYISEFQSRLNAVGDAIGESFFMYEEVPRCPRPRRSDRSRSARVRWVHRARWGLRVELPSRVREAAAPGGAAAVLALNCHGIRRARRSCRGG